MIHSNTARCSSLKSMSGRQPNAITRSVPSAKAQGSNDPVSVKRRDRDVEQAAQGSERVVAGFHRNGRKPLQSRRPWP
jgi:hypothetical protein